MLPSDSLSLWEKLSTWDYSFNQIYLLQGGMKAVLWADTLQFVIMVAGLIGIIIQGTLRVGGIQKMWKIAEEGGRLNFFTE